MVELYRCGGFESGGTVDHAATIRRRPAPIIRRARLRFSAGAWLPVVRRLVDAKRHVGLSFDDGPGPDTTPAILELLRTSGATATFFVTGENAAAEPALVRGIVAGGHDVFSHGWRHVHYDRGPVSALLGDLRQAEATLVAFRPTPAPYLVRLPYGAGHTDATVHRALRKWNPTSQIAEWDRSIDDWRLADGCADEDQVRAACASAADAMTGLPDLGGSILLIHENPYDVTASLKGRIGPLLLAEMLRRFERLGLVGRKIQPLGMQCPLRRFVRS